VGCFLFDQKAASAAEFAMVLPAALLLLFGVIDVGRYAWQLNEYEKATQMGVRYAVVTNLASTALAADNLTWVGRPYCDDGIGGLRNCNAGETISASGLGTITCTQARCEIAGAFPGTFATGVEQAVFDDVVARMRTFQPRIAPEDVSVEYRGSGIGFAGDPNLPEVSPIVTIRVNNAQYSPITLSPFGGSVPLPDFSYSLTLEDGQGSVSN
jgi:hypothetical protein